MKAALEAAAIIEERVDGFETRLNGMQESVDALQKDGATKAEVNAVEQRARDAREQLGGTLKQKADLEQVNQCVQAIRHEVMEVVKRKANSEVVESGLQELRNELAEVASLKAVIEDARQQAQNQVQAVRSELSKMVQEQMDVIRQQVHDQVQAVRGEFSEKVQDLAQNTRTEISKVEQHVHAVRKETAEALSSKAELAALDQHVNLLRQELNVKVDLPQVNNQVQAVQHELLEALGSKASREQLEHIDQNAQAMRHEFVQALSGKADVDVLSTKVDKEQVDAHLEALQQRLAESLELKMDKQQVEAHLQQVLEAVGTKVGGEQLEIHIQDLDQRLDQRLNQRLVQLSGSKADKEAFEAYVTHAQGLETRLAHMESSKVDKDAVEGYVANLQCLQSSLAQMASCKETVDACVLSVQNLERSLAQIACSKVDTEKVVELVEAVRDEVSDTVHQTRNISEQVEKKLNDLDTYDLSNLDTRTNEKIERKVESVRQEIVDVAVTMADEHLAVAKEEVTKLVNRKVDAGIFDEIVTRVQTIESQASTRPGTAEPPSYAPSEGGDNAAAHAAWVESLMEQRMRLVRTELTKLVDKKADNEHMQNCIQAATQEITNHVDRRVDAAQKNLSEQVGRLAAEQESVNRRILQVEKQVLYAAPAAQPTQPAPQATRSAPIEFKFDDSRTARVKALLTQLVDQ
mmetsp:Transcript_84807/g.162304  ORF Transcript_84807/g.162304 Transcript_84807/m.162304 type:complete len:691 (-) Transcript_84807:73-2145(-)